MALLYGLLEGKVSFARKGAVDAIALQLSHITTEVAACQAGRDLAECERQGAPVSERNLIDHQVRRLGGPRAFPLHRGDGRLAGIDPVGEVAGERAVRDVAAEEFGQVHVLHLSLDRDGAVEGK